MKDVWGRDAMSVQLWKVERGLDCRTSPNEKRNEEYLAAQNSFVNVFVCCFFAKHFGETDAHLIYDEAHSYLLPRN